MSRIQKVIQFLPKNSPFFYDLYCDHGKLGLSYHQGSLNSLVTFIDNKKHIIEKIEKVHFRNEQLTFKCEDARLTQFNKNSVIAMLGTGAYLVIDCLENYQKHDYFKSYQFYIAVNMHHFELRHYLIENNLYSECLSVITDGHYCYELIKVGLIEQKLQLFDPKEWDFSNPVQKRHLLSKLKSYQQKKEGQLWEIQLLKQLSNYLL